MRQMMCILGCLLSLSFSGSLLASSKQVKIGDYTLDGRIGSEKLVLNDGNVYKPYTNTHQASHWLPGDSILLLRGKRSTLYILVNHRTGKSVKAKILGQ